MELKICKALQYRFQFAVPNDYIDTSFPQNKSFKQVWSYLPIIIEMAMLIPKTCEFQAIEIYYGSLFSIIERREINLS